MAKVNVEINEVRIENGNNFIVRFSHWNTKVNDGTGGYLFGILQISLTEKGIEIINLSDKRIPIKVTK